jgi:N-acyl-D-aspartate/D-glutamate deacylase
MYEDGLQSQAEVICHLASKGGAQMIYENISERDMIKILSAPYCMIGSDSGIRSGGEGRPHPRGYGSAPRLLSQLAIEMKTIPLEEAVRKMTALPAEALHIHDRGRILDDYWADIVIFDPDTIKDRATYESPFQRPSGILFVLINGTLVVDRGETVSHTSGKVIKS